jgi:hypothetical protein
MWEQTRDEVQMTLDALKVEIQSSGYSWRKMEVVLKLGNGYFSHLFAGRIDLKFRHVVAICEVLGLSTHDFFARAYGIVPRPAEGIRLEELRPLMHDIVDIILTERGYPRPAPALPEPEPAPGSAPDAGTAST